MRYIKSIFEEVEKIQDPNWDNLVVYKSEDVEKLCSNFSFDRDFKKSLDRCLTDLYGDPSLQEKKYSYDKTPVGFRRLTQTILNNLNWYCHSKKLYKNQIYLPGLQDLSFSTHIDSIYYQKKFMKGVKRLFDYMWAFRKAIFIKNPNKHQDVVYLQKNIFKPLIDQELIITTAKEKRKESRSLVHNNTRKFPKFKTYDPDSKDQDIRHIRAENARKNTSSAIVRGPQFEKLNKSKRIKIDPLEPTNF